MFRKPAWEHSDAQRRADAVANSSDSALVSRLPDIARHDADASVRRAALARIDDLSLLADRARLDADAVVRSFAEKRLRQALVDGKVDINQRARQVRVLEMNELLEHVAIAAPEPDLREEALARIHRKGFLVERACKDADAGLRSKLLARIDEPQALERIAESVRKSDKNLAREARAKAMDLRLSAGDTKAIATRAEEICAQLQFLVAHRGHDASARLEQAERDWLSLKPAPDAGWQAKFAGLTATVRDEIAGVRPAVPAPAPTPTPVVEPVAADLAPAAPAPDRLDPRLMQALAKAGELQDTRAIASWSIRLDETLQRLGPLSDAEHTALAAARAQVAATQAALSAAEQQLRARQQGWQQALDAIATMIEQGAAQQALARFDALKLDAEANAADQERGFGQRLKRVEQQLAKVRHWQRWSNNEQRVRWCEAIEQLPEQGLHPDALLTRIREAQNAMAKLDELEGLSKEEAQVLGLNRRFRALVSRAIAPAKPYLNQRAEKREQTAQQLREQLAALSADAGDCNLPLPKLLTLQRQLRDLLDATRDLEGRERKSLGDAVKLQLDGLKARVETLSGEGEAQKRKLIAGLRRELVGADPDTGRRLALDAQEKWKQLPRLKRALDDQLWTELRALIDPVFERLREARAEEGAKLDAVKAEAEAAIAAILSAAGKLRADAHAAVDQDIADARAKFDAIDQPARELERGFRDAWKQLDAARSGAKLAIEHGARLKQKHLATLLANRAEPAAIQAALAGLHADLDLKARAAWAARVDDHPHEADDADDLAELHDLAIRAEMLADVESPADDRDRRRELSMARLAERMGRGDNADRKPEAIALWQHWCLCRGFAHAAAAPLNTRVETALGKLLGGSA